MIRFLPPGLPPCPARDGAQNSPEGPPELQPLPGILLIDTSVALPPSGGEGMQYVLGSSWKRVFSCGVSPATLLPDQPLSPGIGHAASGGPGSSSPPPSSVVCMPRLNDFQQQNSSDIPFSLSPPCEVNNIEYAVKLYHINKAIVNYT